ncbi:MAG: RDD family protein [Pontiellaceae bacterium]|nr:RDD family protein [Pontiellaceae bacterium]MBN2786012.1 RDD family protein [Pontiellaceae bacterium]
MLNIRTPEGVVFSLMLGGPVVRLLAWLVDAAAITLIAGVVQTGLTMAFLVSSDMMMALGILLTFAITLGYGIFFEWRWNGQTIGKRLLRLRVVDEGGRRLHFSQVVVRNLLRFVDVLPLMYMVGGISCLVSARSQRLGDLAAGTIVIRQPKIGAPDVKEITGGKYNSFSEYPYLEARLRAVVTPREVSLALSALVRRNDFDDASRLHIFQVFAEHFQSQVQFPDELLEGISDEQYVRNVVSSVYRSGGGDRR